MITRFWRWLIGPIPHDWTRWELFEIPATGMAAAFGNDVERRQRRLCNMCGLIEEMAASRYETPKECNDVIEIETISRKYATATETGESA